MNAPATSAASTTNAANAAPRRRARHLWIPVLVILALVAWWLRQSADALYATFFHVVAVLLAALAISLWYLVCGGFALRTRSAIIGIGWLVGITLLVLFKPVPNGAMGIHTWRPRFATPADRLLEEIAGDDEAVDWQSTPHDYPRFLGKGYWAEVSGARLQTDWKAHPPQEIWRREIGAGWSAFAVVGHYAVTQEQRGDRELVVCYRVADGSVVWTHADATRFDPRNLAGGLGGIGPRATPTLHHGMVLTQGATGFVNCLDARTGRRIWWHDTIVETGADPVTWGKSGSPLVVDDLVIVSVGAPATVAARESFNASLVAYDLETGALRWAAGNRVASYASPVLATLAGVRQIIMVNESCVTAHRVSDGAVLWEYPWADENDTSASASQPIPLPGDRLFLSKGYGVGASLVAVTLDEAGSFAVEPRWDPPIKRVMKTKFSNVVVRDGFVYGLDDVLLSCIELETGKVRWKKRRNPEFGYGQILLVGDVILVLSETGELAAVEATPDEYRELASIQALDSGDVTWNTPALAPPYLLVRNAREAACYRLPMAEGD